MVARLGTTRFRHSDRIICLAYAPDGKVLATGSADDSIRLWEPATGKLLRVLADKVTGLHALAFSPDGRFLAAAWEDSGEAGVRVWNRATAKQIHTFAGGGSCVTFSRKGGKLLSAGSKGDLRCWNASTGQEVFLPLIKLGTPLAIVSGRENKTLLASAIKSELKVWDVEKGKELTTFTLKDEPILCAAFSLDGNFLAAAGGQPSNPNARIHGKLNTLRIFESETGRLLHDLDIKDRDSAIRGMAFSPDSKLLATGSDTRVLRLWDVATGKHLCLIQGPSTGRDRGFAIWHPLAFAPNGRTIVSGGAYMNGARIWSVANGKPMHEDSEGHEAAIYAVAASPDGKWIASGGQDERICVWEASTGKILWERSFLAGGIKRGLVFSPDSKMLASAADDQSIWLFDAPTGKELRRLKTDGLVVRCLAFAPDGRTLAGNLVNWDAPGINKPNQIRLWDTASGQELWKRDGGTGLFCHLAFSPDGKKIFSAHQDQKIRTWSVDDGKQLAQFTITTGDRLGSFAFSRDGKLVATSPFGDPDVFVWNLVTGKLMHGFHIDRGTSYRLAFSPDSRYLAAGSEWVGRPRESYDRKLQVWELATGKQALEFELPPGTAVSAMTYGLSGAKVVTGMIDSTVLVWDLTKPLEGEPTKSPPLDKLWADLADDDAGKALRAAYVMAASGEQAATYLKERLTPTKLGDAKQLEKLVNDLDSNQFSVREAATKELAKLGEGIAPFLRRILKGQSSAEARKRIESILALWQGSPTGEAIRSLRCIHVLELIATPLARQLLRDLAAGAPARQTSAARAAIDRLRSRP